MSKDEAFHALELTLPHTLTVLCTYQCTAACAQCCFESSPKVKGRLSLDTILARISEAKESFPGLSLVVFSGGEAFILKDDLHAAIAHATALGMMTRVVSNGSWGKTPQSASSTVEKLVTAGITEINLSTGLDHLQWVPQSSVVNAALALCERGVTTLVTVEADTPTSDCFGSLTSDPQILKALRTGHLQFQNNSWMPFSEDAEERERNFDESLLSTGCSQVFGNIVVTPHDNLSACCGLTLEHIPEMRLGKNNGSNMHSLYETQYDDFLKFWIHVDGPHKIVKRVMGEDSARLLKDVSHICQACVILHKTPEIREKIASEYAKYVPEVMTRFAVSTQANRAISKAKDGPALADSKSQSAMAEV
jgi:hypothetical protein